MKVHVLKPIRVLGIGGIRPGREVDLPDSVAKTYLAQGAVEPYQTKVLRENPMPAAGAMSSASPVAPASPQTMSKPFDDGAKPKSTKRKKAAELSS